MANETVNYDIEIKTLDLEVIKKRKSRQKNKNKFNSCFWRRTPEQNSSRLSAVHINLNWKKYLPLQKSTLESKVYRTQVIPNFTYSFKPFSILKLAWLDGFYVKRGLLKFFFVTLFSLNRSSHRKCPVKKGVFKSFLGKYLWLSLF